jgi:dihydroxyacetone kinase-like protein
MKKIINNPVDFVDDMLGGILAAHSEDLACVQGDKRCIVRKQIADKVALVTGGGSGHLPLFMGYVGSGLLDGCAIGGVFQSPSADQMFEVTKQVSRGKGVIYIYGNYSGDIMNFEMCSEMAGMENIKTLHVVGADDVASAPIEEKQKRRGVAGIFFVYKTAGAAAEEGKTLEEVKQIADRAAVNVRTMGVALSPCTIPEAGKPSFTIAEDEMEIGMGIHGEPGISRTKLKTADETVDIMLEKIFREKFFSSGDEVAVLINGLGATPKEELYIAYRRVGQILEKEHLKPFKVYVGEFATSMEMAGFSVSLFKLDAELKRYLSAPAYTPFFEQRQL